MHVRSYCDPLESLFYYKPWIIKRGLKDIWVLDQKIQGRRHRVNGREALVLLLPGIENCEQAALWHRAEVYVPRSSFRPAEEGEYYWADLQGLTVQTHSGRELGRIKSLYENANYDVILLDSDQHIPFVMGEIVLEVRINEGLLIVIDGFEDD
jgi:16S rRNA processing protein RimM